MNTDPFVIYCNKCKNTHIPGYCLDGGNSSHEIRASEAHPPRKSGKLIWRNPRSKVKR